MLKTCLLAFSLLRTRRKAFAKSWEVFELNHIRETCFHSANINHKYKFLSHHVTSWLKVVSKKKEVLAVPSVLFFLKKKPGLQWDFSVTWSCSVLRYWDCSFTNLNMTQLGYLNSWVGDWNWATCFQPVEEPFFNRVVIQGSIDIDRPYRSPVNTPWIQQALCLKLPLVPALWVNCIGLHKPPAGQQ